MLVAILVAVLTATYLLLNWQAESDLQAAGRLAAAGAHTEAARVAQQIERPPASIHAALLRADSLARQGRLLLASGAYAEAAIRAPNDWRVRRDWAILERRLARAAPPRFKAFRLGRARRQMKFALELNPKMQLPQGFVLAPPARPAR